MDQDDVVSQRRSAQIARHGRRRRSELVRVRAGAVLVDAVARDVDRAGVDVGVLVVAIAAAEDRRVAVVILVEGAAEGRDHDRGVRGAREHPHPHRVGEVRERDPRADREDQRERCQRDQRQLRERRQGRHPLGQVRPERVPHERRRGGDRVRGGEERIERDDAQYRQRRVLRREPLGDVHPGRDSPHEPPGRTHDRGHEQCAPGEEDDRRERGDQRGDARALEVRHPKPDPPGEPDRDRDDDCVQEDGDPLVRATLPAQPDPQVTAEGPRAGPAQGEPDRDRHGDQREREEAERLEPTEERAQGPGVRPPRRARRHQRVLDSREEATEKDPLADVPRDEVRPRLSCALGGVAGDRIGASRFVVVELQHREGSQPGQTARAGLFVKLG